MFDLATIRHLNAQAGAEARSRGRSPFVPDRNLREARIERIVGHGTIVQWLGVYLGSGEVAVVNWDHRCHSHFAADHPELTLPFTCYTDGQIVRFSP